MKKRIVIAFLVLSTGIGCASNKSSTSGPAVTFKPLQSASGLVYRSIPYPNDLYSTAAHNDIAPSSDPNIARATLDNVLIPLMNREKGFGTSSAVLFTLSGPVDPSSLPQTVQASLQPTASAFIIDIDQHSPGYGKLTPAVFIFTETSYNGSTSLYTLGIKPSYGYPLEQSTQYAVVITTKVKGLNDAACAPDSAFNAIKSVSPLADPLLEKARELYAPLFSILSQPPYNLGYKDIAGATVFTTEPITPVIDNILSWLTTTTSPAAYFSSTAEASTVVSAGTFSYTTGEFTSPTYLTDTVSGTIQIDAGGSPVLQGWQTLYFSVTVPPPPVPASGYPLAIVQHGLGSDRTMVLDVAGQFSQHGIACISINAVDHGDRQPAGTPSSSLDFLNFVQPLSIRDHFIQNIVDLVQLSRLAMDPSLATGLSALMGRPVSFDTSGGVSYIGQSLGGILGSFYIGVAPYTKYAVINVGGGELSSLLLNSPGIYTEYMPIIENILAIPSWIVPSLATDEVSMFQALIDPGDAINYGRFVSGPPLIAANFTKQVLFQMGDLDQFMPHISTEGMATAMGISGIARGDGRPLIILPWFTFTTYTPPAGNGIYQFYGTHGMINVSTDTVRYSETYPFTPLNPPLVIDNPITQVQEQAAEFLTTGTIINPP